MKQGNDFVKQAIFLSISGILVRLIGVLYGIPLTGIIKDLGNGYYSSAYTVYSIILLVCSYSIPMAVSKIMSEKRAMKQYRTANRVFICAMLYVIAVGGIGAVLTFVFADSIVDVPQAAVAMRVLAPTIFFSGIVSVLRGYFQAGNSMVPTAISQLIEQIFNAVVSVLAAYLWSRMYIQTADEIIIAKYGAAGAAVGTGSGVASSLVFLIVLFILQYKRTGYEKNPNEPVMAYTEVIRLIFVMVTPVILSTCIYNVSTLLDLKVYYKVLGSRGIGLETLAKQYGMYSRKYSPLSNVPIALASSMVAAIVPEVSVSYARKNISETNEKIAGAIRFSMLLIIPASVGMAVLAEPIMDLLFPGSDIIAARLLQFGAISIIFYGVSTVLNGVLQGIGKVTVPMKNAVLALIMHLVVLIPVLYFSELGIYAILLATTVYSTVISWLNMRKVRYYLGYRQELRTTFIMPMLYSAIMGIVTWISFWAARELLRKIFAVGRVSTGLAMAISIIISVAVYFTLTIRSGAYDEELKAVPLVNRWRKK